MSYSSLYCVSQDLSGHEVAKFHNSWLFGPVIWGVLADKYLHCKLNLFERDIIDRLNAAVNTCDSFCDRICWELSMQQVFFTCDKDTVAESIRFFMDANTQFDQMLDSETQIERGVLTFEHIRRRFNDLAEAIETIDSAEPVFFILKNTSVDDAVESYFRRYNEDLDEYVYGPLGSGDVREFEFVNIYGKNQIGFIPASKFHYESVNA